jgi:hypothetical protein
LACPLDISGRLLLNELKLNNGGPYESLKSRCLGYSQFC